MKKLIIPFLLLAVIIAGCNIQESKQKKEKEEVVAIAAKERPNTLTKKELEDGWILMFNGLTTDGWRSHNGETFPDHGWEVVDGTLHVIGSGRGEAGGGGDILFDRKFSNFELSLEWKAAPGANSGIMYRVGDADGATYMSGPEFQIFDDKDPTDDANISAGALYGLYSPKGKRLAPAEEVNHARIVVTGDRVEHYLNGVLVVDAMLGDESIREVDT